STQGVDSTEGSTRGGVAGATVEATGGGTNAFRLVNSEGDRSPSPALPPPLFLLLPASLRPSASNASRLSGLIVDVYGERMVVASSAAWVEAHRPSIMHALSHLLPAPGAHTHARLEGAGDGGVGREGQGASGMEEHERIVWRRSVEMLKEEGVVVDGGEGEGRRDNVGEKPADGEAFGGLESAVVEEVDEMAGGSDSDQEGRVERGATVAVGSDHQEAATIASDLPAQPPLLEAASEAPSDNDRVKVRRVGRKCGEAEASSPALLCMLVSSVRVLQVMENGVVFWVAMASGQKTGFYSDQRDSRLFLRSLVASSLHGRGSSAAHNGLTPTDATCNGDRDTGSRNATDGQPSTSSPSPLVDTGRAFPPSPLSAHRPLSRVLDLCCYSGGFAINAALAGASDVTAVDSSPSALSLAAANVVLNGLPPSAVRFERADISAFMQRAVAQQQQWDLVVLDPPKLAPTRKALPRALHRYRRLNSLALRLVAPGGLLMTCSCSGAVSQQHLLPGILRVRSHTLPSLLPTCSCLHALRLSPPPSSPHAFWDTFCSGAVSQAMACLFLLHSLSRLPPPLSRLSLARSSTLRYQSLQSVLGIVNFVVILAGRQVTVVREAGAAPCHPIDPACPEGTYLTNLLAFVH
ncbi:unnamed protein product, partial [Closterium sp. Naga37s-1]